MDGTKTRAAGKRGDRAERCARGRVRPPTVSRQILLDSLVNRVTLRKRS